MQSATASNNDGGATPSKTLCRYFISGACKLGSRCQFSHDRNDQPSIVCRYYLRGACTYGNQCRYDHVKPAKVATDRADSQRRGSTSTLCEGEKFIPNPLASTPPVNGETSAWNTPRPSSQDSDNDKELGLVSLRDVAARSDMVKNSKLRANAKEFVPFSFGQNGPSPPSYARAVCATTDNFVDHGGSNSVGNDEDLLCPYYVMGQCNQGDACSFTHGIICEVCNRPMLHPHNEAMNAQHRQECMAECERDMELAFALARGEGKQCGICFEIVMEKVNPSSRRFGILPGCKHCFCLDCIRKWRRAEQFEHKVIRACPECRVLSDFVVPSTLWVEEEDEKVALLDTYQSSTKQKVCKYYQNGQTECPFGNKCFYRHVEPNGTVVEGDSPRTIRRRQQQRQRAREGEGPSADFFVLWDYLAGRESSGNGALAAANDYFGDDDMLFEMFIDHGMSLIDLDYDSD